MTSPTLIIAAVTDALEVPVEALSGRGRHSRIVLARHIIWHLLLTKTYLSYPETARLFGKVGHSTVYYGVRDLRLSLAANQSLSSEKFGNLRHLRIGDVLALCELAVEAVSAQADADTKRVQSEAERKGPSMGIDIQTQRKLRAIRAEEAQQPVLQAAVATPSTGRAVPSRLTTETRTREMTPHGPPRANDRCPDCGWRTFAPTNEQGANNRPVWVCSRCSWRSTGRRPQSPIAATPAGRAPLLGRS